VPASGMPGDQHRSPNPQCYSENHYDRPVQAPTPWNRSARSARFR